MGHMVTDLHNMHPSPYRLSFSPKNPLKMPFLTPPSLPLKGDVIHGWSLSKITFSLTYQPTLNCDVIYGCSPLKNGYWHPLLTALKGHKGFRDLGIWDHIADGNKPSKDIFDQHIWIGSFDFFFQRPSLFTCPSATNRSLSISISKSSKRLATGVHLLLW